nr:hypothetical protein [uncultured Albidiferax sp.]
MTSNVFYSNLNDFCRKYMVQGAPLTKEDLASFDVRRKKIEAEIFENLALFDQINFKVYGENIPLALLVNLLGEKGIDQLIDQDALKFTLWTPIVVQMVESIDGIDPIASGVLSSKAHTDPEESIELGLNWLSSKPDRAKRRELNKKLRNLYVLPSAELPKNAVDLTKSAYQSGRLDLFGFNHALTPYQSITTEEKERLLKCTDDLLEYSYMLSKGLTSFSKSEFYEFFILSQERISMASERTGAFSKISTIEQFPDLQSLHSQIYKPYDKILEVRSKWNAKRFREWLNEKSDPETKTEITKEYIDAIVDQKGFFQTRTGKLTKTIAMASIGSGIGALIAGVPGSVTGAALIKAAEPAVDFALDLVDEFLLDGLTKGWSPRVFVDDIRKLSEKPKSNDS